ncbi:hypothetical protein HMPREF0650_1681 [Hoylesella buccalis ATCC 35310]|uniref:Uncharacterized protein n=1 Tax=Hoylesella buccalis ATCC 35310 TaxID=679190 RepID=D1W3D9_9BACT|nr:hypothetical protein HMPREF0650_1681 [Hoylesella buccalis ATCC 35310]
MLSSKQQKQAALHIKSACFRSEANYDSTSISLAWVHMPTYLLI